MDVVKMKFLKNENPIKFLVFKRGSFTVMINNAERNSFINLYTCCGYLFT